MSLRDLSLERAYDTGSSETDVLNRFYIPVLASARSYDRITGYFSSASLALAARGIAGLIKNGGLIRILASPSLPAADAEVLNLIRADGGIPDEYVDGLLDELSLDHLADTIAADHVRALGWMLREGRLEIRLVVPRKAGADSLFHQKVGLLRDSLGDEISFSGSINETAGGWMRNVEEFKVFRSWVASEAEFLHHDRALFDRYWENRSSIVETVPIPSAVRRHLISQAPEDIDDVDLDPVPRTNGKQPVVLYPYQEDAVQAWFANGCHGVFEMATGTGKTKTACECIRRLAKEPGAQLVVVTAPYQHIAAQWAEELADLSPITTFRGKRRWIADIRKRLMDNEIGVGPGGLCVIAVQDTACTDDFVAEVRTGAATAARALFVGDEMHGLGAPTFRRALDPCFTHRLGLSATPERWFDDDGSAVLRDFFGPTVLTFGIKEALAYIVPATGKPVLCPYDYHCRFVSLTEREREEYQELTARIVKLMGRDESSDALEMLLFKRAAIIKAAEAKLPALEQILDDLGELRRALIYCYDTEQMESVISVLQARRARYHRFTGSEGTTPSPAFGGLSERDSILRNLSDGSIDAVVAMKCLDEGVDVPNAEVGIILASTGNPREFIQRRGRLLRRASGKEKARIFDVVVTPNLGAIADPRVRELELKIFKKELDRIDEFASNSLNGLEVRTQVLDVLSGLL